MRLLIATTNVNKVREIRAALAGLPLEIETLDAFPGVAEPEETGSSFAENARLKALYYHAATGLPAAADDSGLVVDALDGAPGIHSSRYGGAAAPTYPQKFDLLWSALRARGASGSAARFVCAVAIVDQGRVVFETNGVVEGEISWTARGDRGFGYDPIFYYPPLGRTLGETSGEEKLGVSHRGAAFRNVRAWLQGIL